MLAPSIPVGVYRPGLRQVLATKMLASSVSCLACQGPCSPFTAQTINSMHCLQQGLESMSRAVVSWTTEKNLEKRFIINGVHVGLQELAMHKELCTAAFTAPSGFGCVLTWMGAQLPSICKYLGLGTLSLKVWSHHVGLTTASISVAFCLAYFMSSQCHLPYVPVSGDPGSQSRRFLYCC